MIPFPWGDFPVTQTLPPGYGRGLGGGRTSGSLKSDTTLGKMTLKGSTKGVWLHGVRGGHLCPWHPCRTGGAGYMGWVVGVICGVCVLGVGAYIT